MKRNSNRRGAILLLVAIALVAIFGVLVLVIDHGNIQYRKRMAQAAADAGARAGANEIYRNRSAGEIVAAAFRETSRNGFTHGVDATVTVAYPTTSVNSPGPIHVEVTVERALSNNFASILGISSSTIRARAVAGMGTANTSCLTLTEPTRDSALYVKSGFLTTVDCGIMVNSSGTDAVYAVPNGEIDADYVAVVGGPTTQSTAILGSYASGVPLPPTGTDPLSHLQMPTVGPCNGTYGQYADFNGTSLSPGVYCGGIGLKHGATVTLAPGMYILAGGGLYLKGGTIIGNEVTFVNTNAPVADGGAANYGVPDSVSKEQNAAINIEVNTVIQLSAMTTGPLAGILIFADPAAGLPGVKYTNYLYSSSTTALLGGIYAPNEGIEAKSQSLLTLNGPVVVRSLKITTGQQRIVINGPGSGSGFYTLKYPTIVE